MAFDIAGARSAGYSDAEIADFLGAQRKFDVAQARSVGYSDSEILAHLAATEKKGGIGTPRQFFRGLAPGAIGLAESAATGLSAVLPESMETPVRRVIKSTAETLRAPFAEAPGKEDTILRRLGESVGSTGPFFALGPLGVAGRLSAMGLGVGAGAGEARVRAEQAGATPEQRAQATGLGAVVGTTEMLPVFAFLNRLGTVGEGIKSTLRRALITGGQEGAQEAAANIAQNLIAKGLYDPQQGVFTDTGEALGYGAGTGALISALTDLVLGVRRRTTAPVPALETPPTVEGAPAAVAAEPAAVAAEPAAVAAEPAAVAAEPAAAPAEPAAVAAEPAAVAAEPAAVAAEPAAAPAGPAAAPAEPAAPGENIVTREMLAELGLPLEPKTLQQKGVAEWMNKNVVGRSLSEIADLIRQNPDLVKGAKLQARILRELSSAATTVPPFVEPAVTAPVEETARDLAIRTDVPEPPEVEPGGRVSGVGISEGVRGQQPAADVAPQPAAPVPGRVAPAGAPVAAGDVSEVAAPAPVAGPAAPPREVDARQTFDRMVEELRESSRSIEDRIRALQEEKLGLLTKNGKVPAEGTKKRARFDQIDDELERANAKRSAADDYGLDIPAARGGADARPRVTEVPGGRRVQGVRYQKETETLDPPAEVARTVEAALTGKSAIEAARWLSQNAPSQAYQMIAARVAARMDALQRAGVKFSFNIAHLGDQVPVALISARGIAYYKFKDPTSGQSTVDVWLNGSDVTGKVGVSYETALHELIHAVSMSAIRVGNMKAAAGTELGGAVNSLYDVTNTIIRHFNQRAKDPASLTEFERRIFKRNVNALTNPDEIVAWSLTNSEMQQYLESIPYQGKSLWTRFVESIRRFLGLPAKADTALSEVLRVADTLLSDQVNELETVATSVGTGMQVQSAINEQLLDRRVFQERTSGSEVPLTPDAIAELEGNNVAAALRDFAETTTDPAYKALAERLIPLLRNTKVNIEPELRNKEGKRAAGAASTSGNTIWLDRELGLNEETLLHESVHAATERILAAEPADRTAVQNVAVRELNELWEAAKADSAVKLTPDARGKLSEFVTEALTNPELVQQLKAKPWKITNAWEQFKTILLKAIGVKFPTNAYEAAMASMDTIFSPTLPRGATQTSTPAFKRWFGKSKIVNADGSPKVMYHGTARDIEVFEGKTAWAIFVTANPDFARTFSERSEEWMIEHANQFLDEQQISMAIKRAVNAARKSEMFKQLDPMAQANLIAEIKSGNPDSWSSAIPFLGPEIKAYLPSAANILPLYVKAENPFDYENEAHVDALVAELDKAFAETYKRNVKYGTADHDMISRLSNDQIKNLLTKGYWELIEKFSVQKAIRALGHDGFYVKEDNEKNLAVYSPTQLKSAIGNRGTFDPNDPRIVFKADSEDDSLYHRSSMPELQNINIGETFTLSPGPQGAEGRGVYFSKGTPVKPTTAEGTRGGKQSAIVVMQTPARDGWFVSKSSKTKKFGKPQTWHTNNKPISLQVTNISEINGERILEVTPVSDWVRSPTLPRGATQAEAPARFQSAPRTVEETLAEMRQEPEKQSLRAMISGAFGGPGKGPVGANNDYVADFWTRTRTRLTDRAATVFDSLENAVSKGMISEMESRATKVIQKQAEASNQMLPAFFRSGVIKRDPVGGWVVGDPAGAKTAPAEVLPLIEAWGKKRGLSMKDAWADAARLMESGRQYVFREHNRNRAPDDPKLPVSMTDAQIDTLYPAYKADKDLAKVKEVLDKVRFRLIDQMVEVGRIDADTAKEWKEASEFIPFDRLSDEELGRYERAKFKQKRTVGKGLSALGGLPELANAAWTNRPVGNVLENYFGTLGWMMQQVVRTDALNTTLAKLEKIGQAEDAGKVRPPSHKPSARTYRDGQEHFYTVPTIYHAMAFNVQVAPLPKFLEIFGQISRVLRTSITAMPTFTASQFPQDIQRAGMYSGVKDPIALAAKAFANLTALSRHALKGTLSTATPVMSASGVVGDVDFRSDKPALSLLQEFGYESPTLLKSKAAGKILHRMNELARAGDIAVRKAIYDQTMEETNDRLLALQRAREYINFRTTGAGDTLGILPVMLQTIPFFNAYVQGIDILFRAFTGRNAVSGLAAKQARAKFITMAGSLAAFSTMYALAMAGDDEYENIPLDERDKTWVLGGGIGIPVPSEIGMIFKAIPERLVEATLKYGTPEEAAGMLALSSWFKTALKEYGGRLLPVPAAVKPVAEAWVNYSFFTGRELEGTYLKQLDRDQRITSATSEFAKEVVRFMEATGASRVVKETLGIELSPVIVDNTLRGYLGTTAGFTLAVMDAMFSSKADRPLHHYVGLGSFTYDPVGTRRSDEFYDMREKVTRAHQTLTALVERNPEQAMAYAEANKEKLLVYRAVNAALRELSETRKYKNWLDTPAAAQQLSGAERLRQQQEVQKYEQELMSFARMARTELRF